MNVIGLIGAELSGRKTVRTLLTKSFATNEFSCNFAFKLNPNLINITVDIRTQETFDLFVKDKSINFLPLYIDNPRVPTHDPFLNYIKSRCQVIKNSKTLEDLQMNVLALVLSISLPSKSPKSQK